MVATYTDNLNMFNVGSDDATGIESSLKNNFDTIDTKLGDSLKGADGGVYTSAGQRLDTIESTAKTNKTAADETAVRQASAVFQEQTLRTIAWRGDSVGAPENTLAAFRQAADQGFWGMTADAQLTSDSVWVCLADNTIDRTSDGTGAVASKTWSQLQAFDFGSWYDGYYAKERMPTIDQVLRYAIRDNIVLYLNLVTNGSTAYTTAQLQPLMDLIKTYHMEFLCAIGSNNLTTLQRVRGINSTIPLFYQTVLLNQTECNNVVALANASIVVPTSQITTANMAIATAAGVFVEAQLTNDRDTFENCMKLGVKSFQSQYIPIRRGAY